MPNSPDILSNCWRVKLLLSVSSPSRSSPSRISNGCPQFPNSILLALPYFPVLSVASNSPIWVPFSSNVLASNIKWTLPNGPLVHVFQLSLHRISFANCQSSLLSQSKSPRSPPSLSKSLQTSRIRQLSIVFAFTVQGPLLYFQFGVHCLTSFSSTLNSCQEKLNISSPTSRPYCLRPYFDTIQSLIIRISLKLFKTHNKL